MKSVCVWKSKVYVAHTTSTELLSIRAGILCIKRAVYRRSFAVYFLHRFHTLKQFCLSKKKFIIILLLCNSRQFWLLLLVQWVFVMKPKVAQRMQLLSFSLCKRRFCIGVFIGIPTRLRYMNSIRSLPCTDHCDRAGIFHRDEVHKIPHQSLRIKKNDSKNVPRKNEQHHEKNMVFASANNKVTDHLRIPTVWSAFSSALPTQLCLSKICWFAVASLCSRAGWYVSDLVGFSKDMFFRDGAHSIQIHKGLNYIFFFKK